MDSTPELLKLERDNQNLRNQLKRILEEKGFEIQISNKLQELIKQYSPPRFSCRPKRGKISSPISVCLQLNDWHIGEVIKGIGNEYNMAIASRRIDYLTTKIIEWVDLNKLLGSVEEAVILVLGDLISGNIHEELIETNDAGITQQSISAGYLLAQCVTMISKYVPKVRVEFVIPDNHSRLTRKNTYKTASRNMNHIVGYIAKQACSQYKNIRFNMHTEIKARVQVSNMSYILSHGHTIKGWCGIPWYGIEKLVGKESMIQPFDKLILGHFHTPINTIKFNVGGSLSGTSELDHAFGRVSEPCQTAWLVHPRYGEYNWTRFWLDPARRTAKENGRQNQGS
jgi:hypothetical protein